MDLSAVLPIIVVLASTEVCIILLQRHGFGSIGARRPSLSYLERRSQPLFRARALPGCSRLIALRRR